MSKRPRCQAKTATGKRCSKPQSERYAPCCTIHGDQWIDLEMSNLSRRSQNLSWKGQPLTTLPDKTTLRVRSGKVGNVDARTPFQQPSQTDDQPRQAHRRGLACLGRIVLARGNVGP